MSSEERSKTAFRLESIDCPKTSFIHSDRSRQRTVSRACLMTSDVKFIVNKGMVISICRKSLRGHRSEKRLYFPKIDSRTSEVARIVNSQKVLVKKP